MPPAGGTPVEDLGWGLLMQSIWVSLQAQQGEEGLGVDLEGKWGPSRTDSR